MWKRCKFKRFPQGYKTYCSIKCGNSDIDKINKTSQTIYDKYGVYNISQVEKIKEIKENTSLKHYGIKYVWTKIRKSKIVYNGEHFDSNPEFIFYKHCLDMGYNIKRNPIKLFFECDNKTYGYYPDFEVNGKLYEIKGDHFFENGILINPYDRNQDRIYKAKHQCMIDNNVIIIKASNVEYFLKNNKL